MTENITDPVEPDSPSSPPWGPTAKLVVGLSFVAIVAALLVRFNNIIGPLLLALILAYVLHPLLTMISRNTRLSWKASVNLIYLIALIAVLSIITATGVAVIQQAQNLFRLVDSVVQDLPEIVTNLTTQIFVIGPFQLDFGALFGDVDLEQFINQAIDVLQPVLGQAGNLIASLATRTFAGVAWAIFILLISYFTLSDAEQVPDVLSGLLSNINVPGYQEDIRRLSFYLGRIWNAFMRGQFILFLVTVLTAFIALTILGVRNALVLAFIAGIARFVPYVGPIITWSIAGIVAFFQVSNFYGLEPLTYTLIVVGVLILMDQIFDNIVTPRLYGETLGVHPAAVLVAAIIAANLIGFIGLLLAAPVLATLLLFGRYAGRKMSDVDPWPDWDNQADADFSRKGLLPRIGEWVKTRFNKG